MEFYCYFRISTQPIIFYLEIKLLLKELYKVESLRMTRQSRYSYLNPHKKMLSGKECTNKNFSNCHHFSFKKNFLPTVFFLLFCRINNCSCCCVRVENVPSQSVEGAIVFPSKHTNYTRYISLLCKCMIRVWERSSV